MTELIITNRQELTGLIAEVMRSVLDDFHPAPVEQPAPDTRPFITKQEAAKLLSCSPNTIDNRARDGSLTRHYVGKSVRFDRSQVLALAKPSTSKKGRGSL